MPGAVSLFLRGLWWRRGLTAALLAVSVVTTLAAALGPLYARAAAESILQDHLAEAGPDAGIAMRGLVDIGSPGAYQALAAQAPKPGEINGYDRQIAGIYTPHAVAASQPRPGHNTVKTFLAWRDGACEHLVIVSGRCPTAPNEALASQRTVDAGIYGWHLGSTLHLGEVTSVNVTIDGAAPTPPAPVKVVGTYRPRDAQDPFWFGRDYFAERGALDGPDTVDSLFVDRSEFDALSPGSVVEADFDFPLTTSAIRLNDVADQRHQVGVLLARVNRENGALAASTDLPKVLDAAASEHRLIDTGTLLVTLQLALLAWLVLFQVVSDAVEARGDEIALAKLRGHSPLMTVLFGLGEPLALLAAAVPVGLVLALLVTHAFAAASFVAGVPVLVTWSALWTALVAFAGGAVAVALAGYRTLTRSVLDQWRRTTRHPGHGRLTLVIDIVLAAAAVAGLVVLGRQHDTAQTNEATSSSAALLAPGLLVFAVAIIGVRLLPLACRRLATATRATHRIGTFLASRQVARRPVGLRLAALLAVAVGLATFGVAGESVASGNRTARASAEIGASRVVSVQVAPGLDPVAATRSADPHGTWAMAAATWLPDGGQSVLGTVLAVDSTRLPAIGLPVSGGLSPSELAQVLDTSAVDPITFKGSTIRVRLTAMNLHGDTRPTLRLELRSARQPFLTADGGRIQPGTHTYEVSVPCPAGCQLRGLTWDRPIEASTPMSGEITLSSLDIGDGTRWTPVNLQLDVPSSWRASVPEGHASDRVVVGPDGVHDRFGNDGGGYGGITYAAAPSPIPAVATPSGVTSPPSPGQLPRVEDSSGTSISYAVARTVPVLPRVLDFGVAMDVRFLIAELPTYVSEANWQVWLSADAPADALKRLAAAGLQPQSTATRAERIDTLSRQAPALALLLLLACTATGAVLAVGGTAVSISASRRRRSYELAALGAIGVRRGSLLRAGMLEQLLLLGTALVLGVPTGVLAARLVMPLIPEFADPTPISLRYAPHAAPTALFTGGFVVLMVLVSLLAARALVRVAVPSRLREAE